jgi:hypothetical protein
MTHKINWVDGRRKPQNPPNPNYPNGIDVDLTARSLKTCTVALPYPAPQCGYYMIECPECGLRTAVTTAGRADDPRSVKMACKRGGTDGASSSD